MTPWRHPTDQEVPPSDDYLRLKKKVESVADQMQQLIDQLVELTEEEEKSDGG